MIDGSSCLASARPAIHLAAAPVVDVSAAATAGGLGAAAHAALLTAATGVVAGQAVVGAGALQRAAAAVRERVAALVRKICTGLERRAAADPGRVGSGFAAHVAGSRAAAVELAAAAVVQLGAAFAGIVAAAGARGAAGLSARGALTKRRARAFAVDGATSIGHRLAARVAARRQRAAIARDACFARTATSAAHLVATGVGQGHAALRAARGQRTAGVRCGVTSLAAAARRRRTSSRAARVGERDVALSVAYGQVAARARDRARRFLTRLRTARVASNRATATVVQRAALPGIEAAIALLAARAGGRCSLRAAHAARTAIAVDGRTAAIRQTGAALVLVVVHAGLRGTAAAVGFAYLFGAGRGLWTIFAQLAVATVVERAARHGVGFGRQLGCAGSAALAVAVAHIRLGAAATVDQLAAAAGHRLAAFALLD